MEERHPQHVPVLAREVTELLAVQPGEKVLDCTVGLGGHARLLGQAAGSDGLVLGIDVDETNIALAAGRLDGCGCPYRLYRCNFGCFEEALEEAGIERVDVMIADLGMSSNQLEEADRGFSFQQDGPLDMRMDDRLERTAADLVNQLGESDLADVLYENAQERRSRRIARAIHRARRVQRITRTGQLAEIVTRVLRGDRATGKSKIHPATRTFQALRIAVNDELAALRHLLDKAPRYLNSGGRIGVISFHSLEDGMVKRDFVRRKKDGVYRVDVKKPVTASQEERDRNPRSRSAKFRVAVRIGQ